MSTRSATEWARRFHDTFFILITAVFFVVLLTAVAGAQPAPGPPPAQGQLAPLPPAPPWESKEPTITAQVTNGCLGFDGSRLLEEAIRSATIAVNGQTRSIQEIRLLGLVALAAEERNLWDMLGGKPTGAITVDQAAALLGRLAGTGLFARIQPTFQVGDAVVLDVALTEHATLKKVVVTGLTELRPAELVERLVVAPSEGEIERSRRVPASVRRGSRSVKRGGGGDLVARCPDPLPPRAWLARAEGPTLWPGVAWKGLASGIDRIFRHLRDTGYEMATLSADLAPDGTLTIAVDEGRIETVTIMGVHPRIAPEVRRLLSIEPGRVYLASDLAPALARVRRQFPFVREHKATRALHARPHAEEEAGPDGVVRFRLVAPTPGSPAPGRFSFRRIRDVVRSHVRRVVDHDDDRDDRDDDDDDDDDLDLGDAIRADLDFDHLFNDPETWIGREPRRTWLGIDGRKLAIYLRADVVDFEGSVVELFRHTPVTSFAPGIEVTARRWDTQDRVHLSVDAAFNLALRRGSRPSPLGGGTLAAIAAQERVDWLVGPRVAVPALRIAELGFAVYTLTDTADRWRFSRLDSYAYSLLLNRPNADYFRRTGVTAFLTSHLDERLTVGGEFRFDRYDSMASLRRLFTIFNRDETPWGNPAIDESELGSALLRLEWSSERTHLHAIGSFRRHPETSIVARGGRRPRQSAFRTLNTVELVDPALGGDDRVAFTRVVSDSVAHLAGGRNLGLRLRLRAAGKLGGGALPRQKEEALGGWSALRGYDFKELAGSFSLLGSGEVLVGPLVAFADVGTVRQLDGFLGPKLGVGAAIEIGPTQLAVAWRADDRARLTPEVRFLFDKTF